MISRILDKGFLSLPFLAQDHQIVRVGHNATAKTALKSKLLPRQHKPAHINIRQQW